MKGVGIFKTIAAMLFGNLGGDTETKADRKIRRKNSARRGPTGRGKYKARLHSPSRRKQLARNS